ncbi:MAG: methylenetetrahydrofolate reductase [Alphaproteobacteria bacterium]
MNTPALSFEIFPPKGGTSPAFEAGVRDLAAVGDYVSVTYGASGSGKGRSERAITALSEAVDPSVLAAHLTAGGQSREKVLNLVQDWKSNGIRRIVALRGDAPPDGPDEFACAAELTAAIAQIGGMDLSVACYPEGHPKSPSPKAEMDHLKRKIDAGASRAITQFFFDPDLFLRFRDRCAAAGINVPIVPGILPIATMETLHRFAAQCGASVPAWLDARFAGLEDAPDDHRALSIATCVSLADRLIAEGVGHIHLYTLNRFRDALTVARALGRCPGPDTQSPLRTEEAA